MYYYLYILLFYFVHKIFIFRENQMSCTQFFLCEFLSWLAKFLSRSTSHVIMLKQYNKQPLKYTPHHNFKVRIILYFTYNYYLVNFFLKPTKILTREKSFAVDQQQVYRKKYTKFSFLSHSFFQIFLWNADIIHIHYTKFPPYLLEKYEIEILCICFSGFFSSSIPRDTIYLNHSKIHKAHHHHHHQDDRSCMRRRINSGRKNLVFVLLAHNSAFPSLSY